MAINSFYALVAFICTICILSISLLSETQSQLLAHNLFANQEKQSIPQDVEVGDFLLGVGKGDITGPVVEVNMMGYADTDQSGTGLRQRLYCRAFIIGDKNSTADRIVYLVLDTQSGDTAVRYGILEALRELGPEYDIYTKDNIAVTGTHSHAGPGAWLNYLLPQITSKGFSKDSYQAIVDGSVRAIQRAHENLAEGTLYLGKTKLYHANINRSPYAYLQNPESERSQYEDDVDKDMTLLEFRKAADNATMGVLSWFAVHGTSLYQNNTLIAGDNKGLASYLFEQKMKSSSPGYVAGFSQSNVGDTSPNILGPICQDTGLPCRFNDSTCGGRTQMCRGRGPQYLFEDQGTRSCFEIASRQYEAAKTILDSNNLSRIQQSTISSFHTFVNLSSYTFPSPFNASRLVTTCSAALGYGFAGGTTDGPGAFDFKQGTNDSDDSPALRNPVWKAARGFVHPPTDEQIACQHPKPILLDVGAAQRPYAWTPNIVDIQLMRVGPLIIIISPGEATTMSGRRWRNAVHSAATSMLDFGPASTSDLTVVLGGPANTYTHYIATEEEYSVQRYEGASTLFGKHTLEAYINLTLTSLPYLGNKKETAHLNPLKPGPQPPININASYNFINGVLLDSPGLFHSFGQSLASPDPANLHLPGEVVSARFIGANPRNNFRLENTFAAVEMYRPLNKTDPWERVRDDSDWFLTYHWSRKSTVLGTSEVKLEWEIEEGTEPALYRFKYYGDSKSIGGTITAFEGTSGVFNVGNGKEHDIDGELIKGRDG